MDGSGEAMVEITGTTLSFTLAAAGSAGEPPHAAHIHYGDDARHECPTASDNNAAPLSGETNEHEHFTTTEGAPAYGEIVVSLTKTATPRPTSGLAVDRFAAGDEFEYSRGDVQVTEELAAGILAGESVVVVHGVDYDGDGAYSAGDRGESDLDPALPGEATDPAMCGVLNASQMGGIPAGGVETGAGSTTGIENIGLIGAGVGAVAAVGGAALSRVVASRPTTDDRRRRARDVRRARRPGRTILIAVAVLLLLGGGTAVAVGVAGQDADPPAPSAASRARPSEPPAPSCAGPGSVRTGTQQRRPRRGRPRQPPSPRR